MKKLLILLQLLLVFLMATTAFAVHNAIKEFDPLKNVKKRNLPASVKLEVPFTSQAPYGNWKLPYGEACEEASMIMVDHFISENDLSAEVANGEIVNLVDWETKNGYSIDVSAQDTADIMNSYFGRNARVYRDEEVNVRNIKKLLDVGYPVIVPVAGQMLGNPNFRGSGPPYHMIVLIGYDGYDFYAHEPGTSRGEAYRYNQATLYDAIHDWAGSKSRAREGGKAMVVVEK